MTTKELIEGISVDLVSKQRDGDIYLFLSKLLELKALLPEVTTSDFSDLTDEQMRMWTEAGIQLFVMALEIGATNE